MSKDMINVGVFFGKFLPCHRGHLNTIINASTKCRKLYVVISDNVERTKKICKQSGIKDISLALRVQWLSQELIDMPHIKVVALDESNIAEYPNGWAEWTQVMKDAVPEHIDTFFCGEQEYAYNLPKYFEGCEVNLFDPERTTYNISATDIRENPMKHWDYILGSARPFFAKKILIVGTESVGKTTLVKSLAKLYHTSWSEEVGRYYAQKYLGGNENYFVDEDFTRIAHQQVEQDYEALRSANKVCFFDTDATITQYYSELYLGHKNPVVQAYINPNKYDLVFILKPDVEWVDDGQRLNGDQVKRNQLHKHLLNKYLNNGFTNVIEIGGNYSERLTDVIGFVNEIMEE